MDQHLTLPSQLSTHKTTSSLVETLVYLQNHSRKLDVVRGKILWALRENDRYLEAFGEGVDTWEEFLRSPEIGLTPSEANRMMQMYEWYVLKYEYTEDELAKVPLKSLHYLLPRIKSGEVSTEEVPELMASAKELTFHQFKELVYDHNGQERNYSLCLMKRCDQTGNLYKVPNVTHEQLKHAFPDVET